ncbi:MAG: hypothetical protein ACRD6W_13050, partial [Nitrososphaerales archaeon]
MSPVPGLSMNGRGSRVRAEVLALVVVVLTVASIGVAPAIAHASGVGPVVSVAVPPGTPASSTLTPPVSPPNVASPLPSPETLSFGGPDPGGATTCPHPGGTRFAGQVVIAANGTISPAGAPVTESANRYTLQAPVNGSVLDLASNTTIDGAGCALIYTGAPGTNYGNATGVEVRSAMNVTVENFPITANGSFAGIWINHSASITVYNVSAEHEEI